MNFQRNLSVNRNANHVVLGQWLIDRTCKKYIYKRKKTATKYIFIYKYINIHIYNFKLVEFFCAFFVVVAVFSCCFKAIKQKFRAL